MARLALRGLAARKLRAGLTALAIFFGVAMIAGTLMLTDTINQSFDQIFSNANRGVDVTIKPVEAVKSEDSQPPAFDARVLGRVRKVPGVAEAAGAIFDSSISILDEKGDRVGPRGPPHFASSVVPSRFSPWTYKEGRAPQSADEIGIDRFTASAEGFHVGGRVRIAGRGSANAYTVTGIGRFGSDVPLGGASIALFTLREAQRITNNHGKLDEILVGRQPGVSPQELKQRLRAAVPSNLVVRTGSETAKQESSDVKGGFSFLSTALLVFAAIALFVGGFLIFNTFSITVSQRTHEFGMLRTLGASARQVLITVLAESLAIGIGASILGILGGFGFVALITGLFEALGFSLPTSGLVLSVRTVVVALAVGIASTLMASLVPALRATRVTPLEALRTEAGVSQVRGSVRRRRSIIAAVLTAIGSFLLLWGLFATTSVGTAFKLFGPGLVLLFIGVAMLSHRVIRPIASLVGWPLERLRGLTGRLARENTLRNPSRTTTTAAALMIGLALVTFVATFAAALNKSFGAALDQAFAGDVVLQNTDGFSSIPRGAADAVSRVPGIDVVSRLGSAPARTEGVSGKETVYGLDPATIAKVANINWRRGSDATLAKLDPNGAIVESNWAKDNGIGVGDTLHVLTPADKRVSYRVVGSVRDKVGLLVTSFAVSRSQLERSFATRDDALGLVGFAPGAPFDVVRARVDRLLKGLFPNVESRSQKEVKDDQRKQINQLLVLVYALLLLSVVISLFGVVNTLVLTIHERTREIGMLRAIGTSRRQIRRLIRYESVITAMIGAIIGAAIGLALAVLAVKALSDEGFVLSIPYPLIVVMLALAAVAGVAAAIAPARHSSRTDIIEALQYE
jgi:putative ABC transport system permease protein